MYWVQNGIDDAEFKALRQILYLAVLSRPAVANLLEMHWVRDGVDNGEAEVIDLVVGFNDPAMALSITELLWVRDGIDEPVEMRTIRELSYFDYEDPRLATSVLGLSWVGDDVTELEAEAIDWLNSFRDSRAALMLIQLSWIQDGVDEPLEVRAIQELSHFDYGDPRLAMSVIRLEWLGDGITELEVGALDWLNSFGDSRVALLLMEQGWIQDGIDQPLEVRAIKELSMFEYEDPRLATSVTFDSERPDLYLVAKSPEHMANIWWEWTPHGRRLREASFDFTIHSDPGDFSDRHGLYLMVCSGDVAGTRFYFGLQTDVYDPNWGASRGKGIIFSRWDERDLAWARPGEGGWTQSSDHEGDFIGVRVGYEWSTGAYRMWMRPDGSDEDGEWYGVWLHDYTADTTVWAGSLRFPYDEAGKTYVRGSVYTTLEIYGDEIRPIDIPEWYVSMQLPVAGDVRPAYGEPGYSSFNGQILNSDLRYDAGAVHFRVGAMTQRIGSTKRITFQ